MRNHGAAAVGTLHGTEAGLSQHRVPLMHHNYVHWNGLDKWQGQRGEMWQGRDC